MESFGRMMNQQSNGTIMRERIIGIVGFALWGAVAACGTDSSGGSGPTTVTGATGGTGGSGATGGSGGTAGSGGTGGSTGDGAVPPGDTRPCEGSTLANGTITLTHAGIRYSALVHVPPSYDGTKRTPLLLNWHGYRSNAIQQQIFSGVTPTSDEHGFIVVFPDSPDLSWAAGTCCANFVDGGMPDRDDVGFARALVAEISKAACIDSKRVYSTGMSNGGFMSHRLACEAADVFTAVAAVAGKMGLASCQPSRPVPIIHFHGTADKTITYDTPAFSGEGVDVPEMMKRWADRNRCAMGPDTTYQMGSVTCQTWSQCSDGVLVSLCTAVGMDHCWPGTPFCPENKVTTTDISATSDGWTFLHQFVLP
jgi:polyhydroxybutyrate depolymerase